MAVSINNGFYLTIPSQGETDPSKAKGGPYDITTFVTSKQRRNMFQQFANSRNVSLDTPMDAYIITGNEMTKISYINGVLLEEGEKASTSNEITNLLNPTILQDIPSFTTETEEKLLELRKEIGKLTKKLMKMRANKNRAGYLAKKEERQQLINQLVTIINSADPNNGFFSATKSAYDTSNAVLKTKKEVYREALQQLVKDMYDGQLTLTTEQEDKILHIYMMNLVISGAVHNLNKARPALMKNYLQYHLTEMGKNKGLAVKVPEAPSEAELDRQKIARLEAQVQELLKKKNTAPAKKTPAAKAAKPVNKKKSVKKNNKNKNSSDENSDSDA